VGIADALFTYMAKRLPPHSLGRSCATLGRQHVYLEPERALAIAAEAGLVAASGQAGYQFPEQHPFVRTHREGRDVVKGSGLVGKLTDIALMNLLGFEEVLSIDVSAFEGADIEMDLNAVDAACNLGRRFDFIFDGGTLEHVFHVPNALKNIFDLLAVGGCIFHFSPSNNYVDHGFYQFSPTLLHDYYAANRFSILSCDFIQHSKEVNVPFRLMNYTPGSLDSVSFGGMDDMLYAVAILARRNADSSCNVVPQQSYYSRQAAWRNGRGDGAA